MKIRNLDGSELMTVNTLEKEGNNFSIDGEIMGSLPVRCMLTPTDARQLFKLLGPRELWLLITILFRS